MSNEQNKDALLVDQKDALSFYFDSLLLPDENDLLMNDGALEEDNNTDIAAQSSPDQASISLNKVEQLQTEKDFLQASKQRQESQKEKQEIQSAKPEKTPAKTITAGPISPKPRLKEKSINRHSFSKNKPLSSKITFSTKNNDGEISEQVLIPRSQRLANAGKINQLHTQTESVAKTISTESNGSGRESLFVDKADLNTPLDKKKSLSDFKPDINAKLKPEQEPGLKQEWNPELNSGLNIDLKKQSAKNRSSSKEATQEAPNLDLSLFLPKIKTLSEEEIAQQIEALTQAAVSQAQLESDLAHVAELEQVSKKLLDTQPEELDAIQRNINNAPAWAVPNFQVLLFTVAGLKLAVPLAELNGILEWGDEYITELPGHKSWYLGIIQNQGKNVPVIDTLQQVVPENRWPANYLSEKNFKHIILIDDARWGLACETVLEVVTLKTDSVKWRSSRTRRRWLLGTVIDHMCALLDGSEFAAMLKTGDDSLVS